LWHNKKFFIVGATYLKVAFTFCIGLVVLPAKPLKLVVVSFRVKNIQQPAVSNSSAAMFYIWRYYCHNTRCQHPGLAFNRKFKFAALYMGNLFVWVRMFGNAVAFFNCPVNQRHGACVNGAGMIALQNFFCREVIHFYKWHRAI